MVKYISVSASPLPGPAALQGSSHDAVFEKRMCRLRVRYGKTNINSYALFGFPLLSPPTAPPLPFLSSPLAGNEVLEKLYLTECGLTADGASAIANVLAETKIRELSVEIYNPPPIQPPRPPPQPLQPPFLPYLSALLSPPRLPHLPLRIPLETIAIPFPLYRSFTRY